MARDLVFELKGNEVRHDDIICLNDRGGDAFLVFFSPKRREGPLRIADLKAAAERVEGHINRKLTRLASPYLGSLRRVSVGFSLAFYNPLVMPERLVSRLVEEAWSCVHVLRAQRELQDRCELQEVLLTDQLSTVFQPIVELRRRHVLGYEALSRGPAGSVYQMPLRLFEMAEEADLVFELDRKCRRRALVSASSLPRGRQAVRERRSPRRCTTPSSRARRSWRSPSRTGSRPDRVVLEITEKRAIENYERVRGGARRAHPPRLLDRGRRRGRRLLGAREDRAPQPALPQVRPRARAQHRLELHPARDDARAQGLRRPDRLDDHRRGHRARGRAADAARARDRVRPGLPARPPRRRVPAAHRRPRSPPPRARRRRGVQSRAVRPRGRARARRVARARMPGRARGARAVGRGRRAPRGAPRAHARGARRRGARARRWARVARRAGAAGAWRSGRSPASWRSRSLQLVPLPEPLHRLLAPGSHAVWHPADPELGAAARRRRAPDLRRPGHDAAGAGAHRAGSRCSRSSRRPPSRASGPRCARSRRSRSRASRSPRTRSWRARASAPCSTGASRCRPWPRSAPSSARTTSPAGARWPRCSRRGSRSGSPRPRGAAAATGRPTRAPAR